MTSGLEPGKRADSSNRANPMPISRYIRSKRKKALARAAYLANPRQPVASDMRSEREGGEQPEHRLRRTKPTAAGGIKRQEGAE